MFSCSALRRAIYSPGDVIVMARVKGLFLLADVMHDPYACHIVHQVTRAVHLHVVSGRVSVVSEDPLQF